MGGEGEGAGAGEGKDDDKNLQSTTTTTTSTTATSGFKPKDNEIASVGADKEFNVERYLKRNQRKWDSLQKLLDADPTGIDAPGGVGVGVGVGGERSVYASDVAADLEL